MSDARHLGSDGSQRLAPEILVVAILGNMTPEAIAEAVIALLDGDLGCQPKGSAQAGIAELRESGLTAELPGLIGGKIETAELQELAVMVKPAQVSRLRQYRQRMDRPDPRHLA
jgi:hypothetical protein